MLLRSVALLLLCASVATAATLGLYQAQSKEVEEEKTVKEEVVNPAALSDGAVASVDAAEEGLAAAAAAAEEPEEAEEILTVDQPPAENNEVNLPSDGAAAEEPAADGDIPAGDSNAEETLAEKTLPEKILPEEILPEEILPEEILPEEILVEKTLPKETLPEQTLTEEAHVEKTLPEETLPEEILPEETLAEEILVEKTLPEEAVTQKQASTEEESNEITAVETTDRPSANEDKSSWSLNSIRGSFQTMHGYFDSLVELVGGRDGVCQYRCRYGETPQPRPGYQLPEPNGCSSSLLGGFQLNIGVPVMTNCCDQLDMCYDTCGTSKSDCDAMFRSCLLDICSDLRKSLGFVSQVKACDSMADVLHNTVATLGCRPYMNSQRAACVCGDEERDEL